MSGDIIYLRDLKVDAIIGIFEWERRVKQTLSLDLDMAADIHKAAQSDAIEDALDYKAVAKRVIHFVENSDFQLVETLAEELAGLIMTEFGVPWMRLQINKKGAIRGARDVGVIIERGIRE
ncbi:MAG TPA: dihydroneopterin aldolase [Chromatiales bacterium]|nr:dihydroneopterin aldolase [Chromatiales bacterium]